MASNRGRGCSPTPSRRARTTSPTPTRPWAGSLSCWGISSTATREKRSARRARISRDRLGGRPAEAAGSLAGAQAVATRTPGARGGRAGSPPRPQLESHEGRGADVDPVVVGDAELAALEVEAVEGVAPEQLDRGV